jgi:hypothetical protein
MALEAVVFHQAGGHFGYGRVDSPYELLPWCDPPDLGFGFAGDCWGHEGLLAASIERPDHQVDEWETASAAKQDQHSSEASTESNKGSVAGRRKRRRTKVAQKKEEIETQRMTHIAVERNRRRQMNEYLAVLRSLMPPSYAHRVRAALFVSTRSLCSSIGFTIIRHLLVSDTTIFCNNDMTDACALSVQGDQASIVGGAINYVRELEQLLQSLEVQKSIKNRAAGKSPFAGFFSFPQYSTSSSHAGSAAASSSTTTNGDASGSAAESGGQPTAVAEIEVTMVEGHASLKVLAPRRPKQLLNLVAGLQHLRVPPLHLNMTSLDAMVMYTFSLKVSIINLTFSVRRAVSLSLVETSHSIKKWNAVWRATISISM